MEIQPNKRTVRPDAEAIKRLRLEKGWRVEDLATKAICSVKTVENVERGANVYVFTLAKLAKVLGVEYKTLLPGGEPPAEPPRPEPRVQLQVVLSIPFDQFDESAQLSGFIEFLKQFMKGGGDINVVGVAPGSTLITLEVSMEDMRALNSAFSEGKLAEIHVVDLSLVFNPKPFVPDLIDKTPLIEGTSKDFTKPKIEPQREKEKTHKPDTKP